MITQRNLANSSKLLEVTYLKAQGIKVIKFQQLCTVVMTYEVETLSTQMNKHVRRPYCQLRDFEKQC